MKKLIKILILSLVLFPTMALGAIDFSSGNFTADNVSISETKKVGVSSYKPATMINYKTGYKVAVYSQQEAKRYFGLGYELDKNLLGFSVVTNYTTTLSSSITSSQTTLPVGTTKDKKGVQLATSTLGMKIYLNIEPGGKKEELVICTGISGNTWTGCTRGLAFSGTDESSIPANQYNHSQGSVVVMSNIHYVYNQFVDKINPTAESPYTPTSDYNLTTKKWVENRNGYWEGAVANYAALAAITTDADGAARVTLDDSKLYVWDAGSATWNLAGAGGGAGTVYIDTFLGTESTGDDNKTFTLTSGSYPNKKYLQVYKNGVLQVEGSGNDYVATGSNQAVFEDVVLDDDIITLLVVSVDLYNPAWNQVNDDILPDTDNTYDIGSDTKKFKDVYFSGTLNGDGTNLDDGANKLVSGTDANKLVRLDGDAKLPAVDGSQLANLYSSPDNNIVFASDVLKISADNQGQIPNTSYTKVKEILYNEISGKIRVKFDIRTNSGGHTYYGRIYINGIPVGTAQAGSQSSFVTYTEDFNVNQGDLIQLYVYSQNDYSVVYANFRLYYSKEPKKIDNTIILN